MLLHYFSLIPSFTYTFSVVCSILWEILPNMWSYLGKARIFSVFMWVTPFSSYFKTIIASQHLLQTYHPTGSLFLTSMHAFYILKLLAFRWQLSPESRPETHTHYSSECIVYLDLYWYLRHHHVTCWKFSFSCSLTSVPKINKFENS